jgi:hypothetical protein
MAGDIASTSTEGALLEDDYAHGATRKGKSKSKKTKRGPAERGKKRGGKGQHGPSRIAQAMTSGIGSAPAPNSPAPGV